MKLSLIYKKNSVKQSESVKDTCTSNIVNLLYFMHKSRFIIEVETSPNVQV